MNDPRVVLLDAGVFSVLWHKCPEFGERALCAISVAPITALWTVVMVHLRRGTQGVQRRDFGLCLG